MTKAEQAVIRKYNLKISEYKELSEIFFADIQNLAGRLGLPAYCSVRHNYETIINSQCAMEDKKIAVTIMVAYEVASAQYDLMCKLARDIQHPNEAEL